MSLARIYTTKGPVRKEGLTCGKCGKAIRKGIDRRRTYAVGFRGFERTICLDAACTPSRSERESSAVGQVYDAQDSADLSTVDSYDGLVEIRDAIAEAAREVASEYESNEMFEVNYDLQERAETLNSAADELEGWEPEDDEPTDDGEEEWDVEAHDSFEEAHDAWLEAARESLQGAIDDMELP